MKTRIVGYIGRLLERLLSWDELFLATVKLTFVQLLPKT